MHFIELDRSFDVIEKDGDPDATSGTEWASLIPDYETKWPTLLASPRVVLLAEALCGKTEEFRNARERLIGEGKAAFVLRIEELADDGFLHSLGPAEVGLFEEWKHSTSTGYFFLDSLDEARLNQKHFDSALKKLAREIDTDLHRAHIYISCRVSDWRGAPDRHALLEYLPIPDEPRKATAPDPESILLDPIFDKSSGGEQQSESKVQPNKGLLVVRLAALNRSQQSKLANALGIENEDAFLSAVWQHGLEHLAERPGDLIDLAEYWKRNGSFGTLAEMTAEGVKRRLIERDTTRADGALLSLTKSIEGAEQVAAALTLCKSFTLKAPAQEPDPALSSGAIDPIIVLQHWTEAERGTLLRRGIFAPATYGRIRFHQRTTQEFLAARWIHRKLEKGCPRKAVFELLFAESYGVEVVVPSLRATVAWLALWHDDIRIEALKRDPLLLIQHGDPGSLPIQTRKDLLIIYANKDREGQIADDSLDHRSIWMFANEELTDALCSAWTINDRRDFRTNLLLLIREGSLAGCIPIANTVALETTLDPYLRIIAVQALEACRATDALRNVAQWLKNNSPSIKANYASRFALHLFPKHLSVDDLISVIRQAPAPDKHTAEGFGYHLYEFWTKCPSKDRQALAKGIIELGFKKPHVGDFERVSNDFRFIARHVEPIVRELVAESDNNAPTPEILHLLMMIERSNRVDSLRQTKPRLLDLVRSHQRIQRALFWADVEETRKSSKHDRPVVRYWHCHFIRGTLWNLTSDDIPWLKEDLLGRPLDDDKRVALSALVAIFRASGDLEDRIDWLKGLTSVSRVLQQDIEAYLSPNPDEEQTRKEENLYVRKRRLQEDRDKESWRSFRRDLIGDPKAILDPKKGFWCLQNLTRWLEMSTKQDASQAPRQWQRLEYPFDGVVATTYRDAMKNLWRNTKPERPRRKPGNAVTTKWVTIFSFAGIGIEADTGPSWAKTLLASEARIAALHACLSGQGFPEWLDTLLEDRPDVVATIIEKEILREWKSSSETGTVFLARYANSEYPIHPLLHESLIRRIFHSAPALPAHFDTALRLFERLQPSEREQARIVKWATNQFARHSTVGEQGFALRYLALVFLIDPTTGLQTLERWMAATSEEDQGNLAIVVLGALFNREERGIASRALNRADPETLLRLIQLSLSHVRPSDDQWHDGAYSPDIRDRAQSARSHILASLINCRSESAYQKVLQVAKQPQLQDRSIHFLSTARSMAERDSEPPAWTEQQFCAFSETFDRPIRNGADLLNAIQHVLSDVAFDLDQSDASSRRLLAIYGERQGDDETILQNWLAERLRESAKGRYHVSRESEVANRNRPDILVSGASGLFEVAIEVKPADAYSVSDLEKALKDQTADQYLKPGTRRHGILVLFDFGRKGWLHPNTRRPMPFNALVEHISDCASTITTNLTGAIALAVAPFQITADPPRSGEDQDLRTPG